MPDLMKLHSSGYEFELDMLLECKRTSRTISEVAISTIYLDGNRSSHFNRLFDSMRIYFLLMRFAMASMTTAVIDNVVFIAAFSIFANVPLYLVFSRVVAGLFNYFTNKKNVFHSQVRNRLALPKYWLSVVIFASAS